MAFFDEFVAKFFIFCVSSAQNFWIRWYTLVPFCRCHQLFSLCVVFAFRRRSSNESAQKYSRRPPVRRKAERRDENGTRTRRVLSQPIPLPSSLSPKMELMLTTRRRFRRRRDIENNVTSIIIEDGSSFSLLLRSYWRHHLCRRER